MFDGLTELLSAWREVLHISEWTGLGLGGIGIVAAAVYFIHIPFLTAARIVVLIVTAYFCLLLGDAVGTRDKQRQWDAARASAAKAQEARDATVARELEAKYRPQLEAITRQAQASKDQADAYEKKMLVLLAKQPAGACQLGSLAGRLHLRR